MALRSWIYFFGDSAWIRAKLSRCWSFHQWSLKRLVLILTVHGFALPNFFILRCIPDWNLDLHGGNFHVLYNTWFYRSFGFSFGSPWWILINVKICLSEFLLVCWTLAMSYHWVFHRKRWECCIKVSWQFNLMLKWVFWGRPCDDGFLLNFTLMICD